MNEKLREYRNKRNFTKTREPEGGKARSGKKRIFVVQYHEARSKHYDFRLEWKGTLLSWAVPKGPSTDPKDKRLAVRVEDHPLEYAEFEGTIPKGEYGGGTVKRWDHGYWTADEDFEKGLKEGALKFTLHGEKLNGSWTLVRMKTEGERNENWLLIKEKRDSVIAEAKNPFNKVSVQLCKLTTQIPEGEEWLFEVKYDGYRTVAFLENGKARLMTRNNKELSDRLPSLTAALAEWSRGRAMVLDGETVVADADGKTDFQALQRYFRTRRGAEPSYKVFDLLSLDGKDYRQKPLIERKKALERLLVDAPDGVEYSAHVTGRGKESFAAAKKLGLEGVVGKLADSVYDGDRNGAWIKIKCYKRDEFVIGGYTPSKAKKSGVAAVLLGVYEGGKLIYRGRSGTGIPDDALAKFRPFERKICPFAEVPPSKKNEEIVWLKPELLAEIQYAEITDENLLRQASFKGFREDKDAEEVTSEAIVSGVEISSPSRPVFKNPETSKLEVAKYYAAVAERMLPYIKGRIASVVRCHDGVDGEKFFKKHPTGGSGGVPVEVKDNDGDIAEYFYLDDKQGIIEEVQLGTVEFHTWGSLAKSVDEPDVMVFDLDPDEGMELARVRKGVADLKSILDELKLTSFLKTSGGKGYHVVVPFRAADWQEFHDFSKRVAELMEEKWPDRYTANVRKTNRKNRIYIDWVRNGKGATSVAPYSLRAREGAAVSMPIAWSELNTVAPNGIDMKEAVRRIKKSDPWKNFFS